MDSKKHSIATGAKARISTTEGGRYSAHGNYINGKNLQLVKNRLIVQTWRANNWNKNEVDSILIIFLQSQERGTILYLTHANVPENEYSDLKKGWNEYYWTPWKKYLKAHSAIQSNITAANPKQ